MAPSGNPAMRVSMISESSRSHTSTHLLRLSNGVDMLFVKPSTIPARFAWTTSSARSASCSARRATTAAAHPQVMVIELEVEWQSSAQCTSCYVWGDEGIEFGQRGFEPIENLVHVLALQL